MNDTGAVARLVASQRLERVPADLPAARSRLTRAAEKLMSARAIAPIDLEVAYVTAYDAMRIAVTAHMLAKGYRVRPIARAHEAVGEYAAAVIDTLSSLDLHFPKVDAAKRTELAEVRDTLMGTK